MNKRLDRAKATNIYCYYYYILLLAAFPSTIAHEHTHASNSNNQHTGTETRECTQSAQFNSFVVNHIMNDPYVLRLDKLKRAENYARGKRKKSGCFAASASDFTAAVAV